MRISILDQTPVADGFSAVAALQNSKDLAQKAEEWGYHRFWVSEHHDSQSLGGSSPEVLLSYLGAHTKNIRIGSGGVMLTHYSPFKIAENFHLLEGLFPGRIDAGMGRAPGGMPRATLALSGGTPRRADLFPRQVDDLLHYLHYKPIPEYAYGEALAAPVNSSVPPLWILGSSAASAALAAEKGLPYNYAHFINEEGGTDSVELYQELFQPSSYLREAEHIVTVFVVCADTERKAQYIASSLDLSMLTLAKGMSLAGTPDPAQASIYNFTEYEKDRIKENRKRMIIGSPAQVRAQLEEFAERYKTKEIMICTITYYHEDRLRSYELVKDMFN
ncbi:LLM class flavin-dependent oxidoreductase [Alkalicoccus daliensis]|uniref:Luciferase family oxidoreductase, group 1 n=1 Tax=Alkalicoccus daliensis TaxID=745820 RepID=A0A1H0DWT7_9BACI|nr:LLM class flavin-dependent oxidoreductase [Alkalicoccus daliensis]SDN74486.1 luciferase family oxidoreductase, group 1 [Alkalicoccus daliensis]